MKAVTVTDQTALGKPCDQVRELDVEAWIVVLRSGLRVDRDRLGNRIGRESDGSVCPQCRPWSSEGGRVQLEVLIRGSRDIVVWACFSSSPCAS